jgi:hypothetical protein
MPRAKKRRPLPVGTKGHATHKGRDYTIEVVAADGGLGYRVGRAVFTSPSAAAKSITGKESNGWVFWHLDA